MVDGSLAATKPTDTEQERQNFETNTAEDVIAVDHSNAPGLPETFAAFQTKLTALQEAASRVIAKQHRQAEETESSVGAPAEVFGAGGRRDRCCKGAVSHASLGNPGAGEEPYQA